MLDFIQSSADQDSFLQEEVTRLIRQEAKLIKLITSMIERQEGLLEIIDNFDAVKATRKDALKELAFVYEYIDITNTTVQKMMHEPVSLLN